MAGEGEGVLNYRRPGEVGHADYSIRRTLRQSTCTFVASHPLIKATHPSLSRLLQPRSAENNTENL